VFQKIALFRFVNVFIPGLRKWGWIVGIIFIDTSAQLTIDKYYVANF
jgi:hypothetical protein